MGYQIVVMHPEQHREALLKVWRENLSDPRIKPVIERRFDWLYHENPLGPATTFLVKEDSSQEYVGCSTLFPREVWVRGQMMRAGLGMDFAVSRRFRVAGAAVALQRALSTRHQEHGFAFVFTYPSEGSVAVLKRVGAHFVAQAHNWVKPTHVAHKLRTRLSYEPAVQAGGFAIDGALALADLLLLAPKGLSYRSEISLTADDRHDDLWDRAKQHYPIVGHRGASYLNWRYGRFPTIEHSIFSLVERKSGRVDGYICFYVDNNKAFVADLFCDRPSELIPVLMSLFASKLRREGIDSVFLSYAGGALFSSQLRKMMFFQSEGDRFLAVHISDSMEMQKREAILDGGNWFLFDGELDP